MLRDDPPLASPSFRSNARPLVFRNGRLASDERSAVSLSEIRKAHDLWNCVEGEPFPTRHAKKDIAIL